MTIFLLPIGIFLFGALLVKLRTSILDALKLSALSYVYSWLFFAFSWVCVWLCTSILNFIGFSLNWGDFILNNKFIIQGILYFIFIVPYLFEDESGASKTTSYKPYKKTTYTTRKSNNGTETVKTSSRNITNLSNDVISGIDVEISFNSYGIFDIQRLAKFANISKAKITLNDIEKVRVDNLSSICKLARGQVYLDRIFDAGFDAEELAKNGACFTCDCKNRSPRLPYVVRSVVQGKGKVVLKNCRWMSSVEISKLRTEGGNYIEIQ